MAGRGIVAQQRPWPKWVVRGLLVVVAVVLSCGSVGFSLAEILVNTDPALAHRLAPYDGRITARFAASLAGEGASPSDRRQADALAREALAQEPTAVTAVSTLGIDAGIRGDANAGRLMGYAQALSRRDLQTQLWAIEDAVRQGDIAGSLHHYDNTLRVWPGMADMLFPILASASTDPRIRAALVQRLVVRPKWADDFVDFAATHATDPRTSAQLLMDVRRRGGMVPEHSQAGMIAALITQGQVDDAWAFYASLHPGADRRRSRDPRFVATPGTPSLLDWTPVNDGGISTSMQGGGFNFSVASSIGGLLLQQTQLLPAGHYVLAGHSSGISQAPDARAYWALACRDGRKIGRIVLPDSAQANGRFGGSFNVPAGCPAQTLTLVARPSDVVAGLTGQIDRVLVSPAP